VCVYCMECWAKPFVEALGADEWWLEAALLPGPSLGCFKPVKHNPPSWGGPLRVLGFRHGRPTLALIEP